MATETEPDRRPDRGRWWFAALSVYLALSILVIGLWFFDFISYLTGAFSYGFVSGCFLALTYLLNLKPGLFSLQTYWNPGNEILWPEFKAYLAERAVHRFGVQIVTVLAFIIALLRTRLLIIDRPLNDFTFY